MDRPACETCPYYDDDAPNNYTADPWGDQEVSYGYCMRHAPSPILAPPMAHMNKHLLPVFPIVCAGDWCGEHPDFPEYIKSLNRQYAETSPALPASAAPPP